MPEIDRRLLIAAPIVVVIVFLSGLMIGRTITGSGDTAVADNQTSTTSLAASVTQADPATGISGDGSPATTTTLVPGDPSVVLPSPPTPPGDIPQYGTDEDRSALIAALVDAGVAGGSGADILATADYVCYTLERLRTQGRSLSFTVRVVWNDSLADLPPEDLSAFGAVLSAAPSYLCPEYAAFGETVSYWLGY